MKKSSIALGILGVFASFAFAESQVTLYGIIEDGVLVSKGKGFSAGVSMIPTFAVPSRWGIRGSEDLGGGTRVVFILEQGIATDTGSINYTGNGNDSGFTRESWLYAAGPFGQLGAGRTGSLTLATQSQNLFTGWVFNMSWGLGSWNTLGTTFGRVSDGVGYKTPVWSGFHIGILYGNSLDGNDADKWSTNSHYYGIGAKYEANGIRSSLVYECVDGRQNREHGTNQSRQAINFGFEYKLGSITPMFAYHWTNNTVGRSVNQFGLSAKVPAGGGEFWAGTRYVFGKDRSIYLVDNNKVAAWNINVAYLYPISKRTTLKAFVGYVNGSKAWKDPVKSYGKARFDTVSAANFNGYQIFTGMQHNF